jgi:uncharacterized RDD family membrane protein YckC
MFCSKCGKKTDDSGKYCQWCGAEVKGTAVAPAPKLLLKKKSYGISTENYAGFGQRFLAWIIDIVFILVLDIFIMGLTGLNEGVRMIYQFLRGYPMTDRYGEVVYSMVPTQVIYAIAVLLILVPWLYYAILESSKNQATLGKIAVRIAVTDLHGSRITFSRATLRFFAKVLSIITFFIGFIIIAFTRQKQGLHDIIAGCLMYQQ